MNKFIPVPHVQLIDHFVKGSQWHTVVKSPSVTQLNMSVGRQIIKHNLNDLEYPNDEFVIRKRCDDSTAQVKPTTGCRGYPMWRLH